MSTDPLLFEAVAKVFGTPFYSVGSGEFRECIYPLQVLRFATADMLLTIGNAPGDSCHGCGARLTAYILKREGGDLRLVARFIDFTEVGSFGSPGTISPVLIGADDGIAIEHGGTFQGYSLTLLEVFAFRKGRALHLTQGVRIPLPASNEGAMSDPKRAINVEASWTIDPPPAIQSGIRRPARQSSRGSRSSSTWARKLPYRSHVNSSCITDGRVVMRRVLEDRNVEFIDANPPSIGLRI